MKSCLPLLNSIKNGIKRLFNKYTGRERQHQELLQTYRSSILDPK